MNVNYSHAMVYKSSALDVMPICVSAGVLMHAVEDRGQPSGVISQVPPTLWLEMMPLIGLDPKESFSLSDQWATEIFHFYLPSKGNTSILSPCLSIYFSSFLGNRFRSSGLQDKNFINWVFAPASLRLYFIFTSKIKRHESSLLFLNSIWQCFNDFIVFCPLQLGFHPVALRINEWNSGGQGLGWQDTC